jgi:hypothetical protein
MNKPVDQDPEILLTPIPGADQGGGHPQIQVDQAEAPSPGIPPVERAGGPDDTAVSLAKRTLEELSSVNETLTAEAETQSSNPFARFWRFVTELFRGTPIENGVRKVLRDALGECKQGETIDRERQLKLLEDMAEIITEDIGNIVDGAENLNLEILDIYAKELKVLLKSFLPRGCSNIFVLRHGGPQRPSCIKSIELLELIDLAHNMHELKRIFPDINFTPTDVALIKERGGRVLNLINEFRKKFPDLEMTPADFTLFLQRPDPIEKIIKNGKIGAEYYVHWQKTKSIRNAVEGFTLNCQDSGFKYTELSAKVNPDLFSEDESTRNEARNDLFAAVQQYGAIFCGDFIDRGRDLAVHLPKGIVIESSTKWLAMNPEKTMRDYLCYVLDKFHEAYGDEAPAAFLVFVQNFTGTENLLGGLPFTFQRFEHAWPGFLGNCAFFGALLLQAQRSLTITMDSKFNMTGDLFLNMPAKSSDPITTDGYAHAIGQASRYGVDLPKGYDPNGEDNVMAIGARFYVPARCKKGETDLGRRWEQPRKDGVENQDTHLRFFATW